MTTKRWQVSLCGKWGGVRTVTVSAATEKTARKRALELARLDERIGNVYTSADVGDGVTRIGLFPKN